MSYFCCFFVKQKTAYEMRISDWSSDVCSSDLPPAGALRHHPARLQRGADHQRRDRTAAGDPHRLRGAGGDDPEVRDPAAAVAGAQPALVWAGAVAAVGGGDAGPARVAGRSEEHTSELQSLMRHSYAVFCLKKKKKKR